MCGQYYIMQHLKQKTIYPTDSYKIMVFENKNFIYHQAKWGFMTTHGCVINAKSETLNQKPLFMGMKHCLILASGYYEWDDAKMKTDIHLENHQYLYMAGLYREINNHLEYTIITTQANQSVAKIHHRMPLILNKNEAELWLKEGSDRLLNIVPVALNTKQEISQGRLDI